MKPTVLILASLVGAITSMPPTSTPPSAEDCKLPAVSGPCMAMFRSWYYNTETSACEQFIYGGCQGNGNRFRLKQECEDLCVTSHHVEPTPYPQWCAGRPMCLMECPFGLQTGEEGCPICKCIPSPPSCAGKPICPMLCANGFQKGPDGCPICACVKDPSEKVEPELASDKGKAIEVGKPTSSLDSERVACDQRAICYMRCPWGFEVDENNCEICKCKPKPCDPRPKCPFACPFGYKNDRFDCPTCSCNEMPAACKGRQMCLMFCKWGYVLDTDGCPTCHCMAPPY